MYDEFSNLGTYEANVLDTTGMTPDETVDAVLRGLADDKFSLQ